MKSDVDDYVKKCDPCQRNNTAFLKNAPTLHSIPVPNEAMKQIGVDITSLPEINGYRYVIVAIDYFTKWSEVKALKDKTAVTVAQFLYKLICAHSCFQIQINDQGREFVNSVSDSLHRLTGVKQRITSAYHPQANGLVERMNRTIKTSLLKVISEATDWPAAINGVLFAHRTTKHASTGFSPFYMLFNREPILPLDLQFSTKNFESNVTFNEDNFTSLLSEKFQAIEELRKTVFSKAAGNITKAQKRQSKAYNKRHDLKHNFTIGTQVLLRNMRRDDRKGGKLTQPWLGPFTIVKLFHNNTCYLRKGQIDLKCKQHLCNLKPYYSSNHVHINKCFNSKDISNVRNNCAVNSTDNLAKVTIDNEVSLSHAQSRKVFSISLGSRLKICKKLNLNLQKPLIMGKFNLENAPRRTHKVSGDGNCFFRAVSYVICGKEEYHLTFRNAIIHHMSGAIKKDLENYLAKNIHSYISQSKMDKAATWATDAELIGSASYFGCDIYVYAQHGEKLQWVNYPVSFTSAPTEEALFLENVSANHFNVVLATV